MYLLMKHEALEVMTIERAHAIMQLHIDCPTTVCPRKRQAKIRLVEAKKMRPDSSRVGY